jgi:hypothetical protein
MGVAPISPVGFRLFAFAGNALPAGALLRFDLACLSVAIVNP